MTRAKDSSASGSGDDDLPSRQRAGRRRERGGRGQRQRAGTGDDQQCERDRQRAGRIDLPPGDGRRDGQHEQPGDEPAGHPVGDARYTRAPGRRARRGALDRGEARPVARRGDPHDQRAVARDAAGQYALARLAHPGLRLAGQDRLVDGGATVDHDTVAGHRRAGAHQHELPGGERGGTDDLAVAAPGKGGQALGRRRLRAGDRLDRVAGAAARGEFDVARDEQQRDEHRDRIVVDGPLPAERGPRACPEGGREPERHRHVHARPREHEVAPGTAEERRRRIEQCRQRQRQAGPLEQPPMLGFDAVGGDVGRQREHHHLHHRQQRDAHPQQQRPRFAARELLAPRRIVGMRAIADCRDGAQHRRYARRRRIEHHARAAGREIDARLAHAGLPLQPRLEQPDAGAAVHSLEQQGDLPPALRQRPDEPGLRRRIVPARPLVVRCVARPVRTDGATVVEGIEARGVDRLRNGQAAGAAEFARGAGDDGPPPRRGWIGQAAVIAGRANIRVLGRRVGRVGRDGRDGRGRGQRHGRSLCGGRARVKPRGEPIRSFRMPAVDTSQRRRHGSP